MKKKLKMKRIISVLLAGLMVLGLAACGEKSGGGTGGGGTGGGGGNGQNDVVDSLYVWVPRWISLTVGENSYTGNFSVVGNRLYYTYNDYEQNKKELRYLDMQNPDGAPVTVMDLAYSEEELVRQEEEGYYAYISTVIPLEDGILYIETRSPILGPDATEADYMERERNTVYMLTKVAEGGTEIFSTDISAQLHEVDYAWIQSGVCDGEGNIFLSNNNTHTWVYDKDGNYVRTIMHESDSPWGNYISAMGTLGDGRLAILQNVMGGSELYAYDDSTGKFSVKYEDLPPNVYNSDITTGLNGGVLLNANDYLYEYDPETQTYETILTWLDCDLNGDYVESVFGLEDGNLLVYYRDWNSRDESIILVNKTPASEVVQKEIITYGTMSLSQTAQSAIVNFNRTNEQYRIVVKDYSVDVDWSQQNAQDIWDAAERQFYNDLVTGNAPDLFDTYYVDVDLLAAKGALADLTPYLEASSNLSKSDMIEPVINAYTYDNGALYMIPTYFTVYTLFGRTAEVGEEAGWTMEEMLAYLDAYPEASIFGGATKAGVLSTCLQFDFDSYVNWKTGEVHFDSEQFRQTLELANRYPAEINWESRPSEPKALRTHEALLSDYRLDNAESWQVLTKMFEEPITAIGYPSATSTGVLVSGTDCVCVSASSQNKEAAYNFIESLILATKDVSGFWHRGFPILKSVYDAMMEEEMTPLWQTDWEGNLIYDEDGNPMEQSNSSYGWGGVGEDITIEIYSVTQEEADNLWKVISNIGGIYGMDYNLYAIIEEEVAPYFEGQKSIDDVIDIIQSKVKIYVSENL